MKKIVTYIIISFFSISCVIAQVYERSNMYFEDYYTINPAELMAIDMSRISLMYSLAALSARLNNDTLSSIGTSENKILG